MSDTTRAENRGDARAADDARHQNDSILIAEQIEGVIVQSDAESTEGHGHRAFYFGARSPGELAHL